MDDAAGLREQPLGGVAVGADPLDVQIVGVLADRDVHRAGQPGQVHVDLHLRPVLRLRLGDALRDQLAEALRRVRLELDDVPGLRRLEEAERDAHRASRRSDRRAPRRATAGRSRDRPRARSRRCAAGCGRAAPPRAGRSRRAAGCGPGSAPASSSGSRTRARARRTCRSARRRDAGESRCRRRPRRLAKIASRVGDGVSGSAVIAGPRRRAPGAPPRAPSPSRCRRSPGAPPR